MGDKLTPHLFENLPILPGELCYLIMSYFACEKITCKGGLLYKKYCVNCRWKHRIENIDMWHQSYCTEQDCFNLTKVGSMETRCKTHRLEKKIRMGIVICVCRSSDCHRDEVGYVERLGSVNWPHATVCKCSWCEGQAYYDNLESDSDSDSDSDSGSLNHCLCKSCDYTCVKVVTVIR